MAGNILNASKSKKFGKIGIAKANAVGITSFDISQEIASDQAKFSSLSTSLGIIYTDNYVSGNITVDRITAAEANISTIESALNVAEGKLSGIESGATADQTGAEIKALYEAEANTNAYSDTDKNKVASVNVGGTTAERPTTPLMYQMYYDTTLNIPIWYNGTDWVDSTGTTQ